MDTTFNLWGTYLLKFSNKDSRTTSMDAGLVYLFLVLNKYLSKVVLEYKVIENILPGDCLDLLQQWEFPDPTFLVSLGVGEYHLIFVKS